MCELGHPALAPADFVDWDNYLSFTRNNNVTWCNFNVVDNEPDPEADPSGYVAMGFLAPGAPDKARLIRLEVVARLPKSSRVLLEMPLAMYDGMRERGPVKFDTKRQMALVPVNPHGLRSLGDILFTAKSRAKLRLLVQISKEYRHMGTRCSFGRCTRAKRSVGSHGGWLLWTAKGGLL
jgi:serine protease